MVISDQELLGVAPIVLVIADGIGGGASVLTLSRVTVIENLGACQDTWTLDITSSQSSQSDTLPPTQPMIMHNRSTNSTRQSITLSWPPLSLLS